jgi:hypothetical protein
MSDVIFKTMQRTFDSYGYTLDPETGNVVGNVEKAAQMGGIHCSALHDSMMLTRKMDDSKNDAG